MFDFLAGYAFGYATRWYASRHPDFLPSLWLKVKALFGK